MPQVHHFKMHEFSNIVPATSEVSLKGSELISIRFGVIFQNEKGWIHALSNKGIRQWSNPLDNPQDVDVLSKANFLHFIQNVNLVDLVDKIGTSVPKVYHESVILGFDKENNELFVINDGYDYSCLFSFYSRFWSKMTGSYSVPDKNYPYLERLDSLGLVRLSPEASSDKVFTLFVTREQSLELNEIYKKLDRSLIRSYSQVGAGYFFSYYIFGSGNLCNWQLTAGNDSITGSIKDVHSSRSQKKRKYYVFVIASRLATDDFLSAIDTDFTVKAAKKLR
jgi:hypothetical protein